MVYLQLGRAGYWRFYNELHSWWVSMCMVCYFVRSLRASFKVELSSPFLWTFVTVILVNGRLVYSAIQKVKCFHYSLNECQQGNISSVTVQFNPPISNHVTTDLNGRLHGQPKTKYRETTLILRGTLCFACSIETFNSLVRFIQGSGWYGRFNFANSISSLTT